MLAQFTDYLPELSALRRDIHAHPEIGLMEERTAQLVANYLRQCGVDEVHEHIGKTGVVGIINGLAPGKSIAFRAELDALSMQEIPPEPRAHCSTVANCFHGCGHDGHTVMLLGAARYLAKERHFAGRIVLIFQPAEEILSGAKAMLEAGLFERFPFEEVYALHNFPSLPRGKYFINQGAMLSASDAFTITIQGKGGHGAVPHAAIDPIVMAARVVMDFQTIVSRNTPPTQAIALSFGEIHGGSAPNIIPDTVHLSGTLRTYDESVRTLAKQRMKTLLESTAIGFGGSISQSYITSCPAVINDSALANASVAGLQKIFGAEEAVLWDTRQSPSDDFSHFLAHAKGVYCFLGFGETTMVHHPHYDFDDTMIPYGIAFWVSLTQTHLPL